MEQSALAKTADIRPIRRKPESLSKLKRAARKLFVERGYHATRPQDIAREAGLGHGTFYLHYPDKKACFLAFVDEARDELHEYMIARQPAEKTLEATIAANLKAIYEYSAEHPGVLAAAMTDELVIDAEGAQATPLLVRWGFDWGDIVREAMRSGQACDSYNPEIVGQAILGAIHQTASEGARSQRGREEVLDNLTRFLVKALKP
ncbi:MAG: TetR/AcrR family transcriptional regulator [Alphaproteobacteria bacterium]|nr:TetR/AcrR family transcriptional regulator [Alphaproteobacteria bacterium]MBL6939097.1 TetR/AcrR family transcriptional regulator [Alphaproteobacteria bacterium]MBL7096614.1 TetR/AcrR family transcriptional regulator [Alphaproteobacteria bacterium]